MNNFVTIAYIGLSHAMADIAWVETPKTHHTDDETTAMDDSVVVLTL